MLAYLSADIACFLKEIIFKQLTPRKLTLRFFIKEDVSPLKPGVRALQSATPTIPGSPIGMLVFFFLFVLWRCNIQF